MNRDCAPKKLRELRPFLKTPPPRFVEPGEHEPASNAFRPAGATRRRVSTSGLIGGGLSLLSGIFARIDRSFLIERSGIPVFRDFAMSGVLSGSVSSTFAVGNINVLMRSDG